MALYSAFRIKDTSGVKISAKFLNDYHKQKEEQLSFKESLPEEDQEFFSISIISEIDTKCQVTNDEDLFLGFYDEELKLFYYDEEYLYVNGDEGETFKFKLEGDYFVGCEEFYSSSDYGWTKDLIISLIKKFKGTVYIEDMGDEEYGFVNDKGCSRELVHETWIDGVKQD